jgi:hypothetical protein
MQPLDTALVSLVQNLLQSENRAAGLLNVLESRISNNEGKSLFSALHNLTKEKADDKYAQISLIMEIAESLMDQNPFIGIYLMARLYPLAGTGKNHEVLNGIRFWMASARDSEAVRALSQLCKEDISPSLRKEIGSWLSR